MKFFKLAEKMFDFKFKVKIDPENLVPDCPDCKEERDERVRVTAELIAKDEANLSPRSK